MTIENILAQFREKFDHIVPSQGGFIVGKKGTKEDNRAYDLSYIPDWLKEKLEEFEKEITDEMTADWYGDKHDIKVRADFLERILPKEKQVTGMTQRTGDLWEETMNTGFNSCLDAIRAEAEKLK